MVKGKTIYVGVQYNHHFKWGEENGELDYTPKAKRLLELLEEYDINHDGLDDHRNGTVLYFKCAENKKNTILEILRVHGFGDYVDVECITS